MLLLLLSAFIIFLYCFGLFNFFTVFIVRIYNMTTTSKDYCISSTKEIEAIPIGSSIVNCGGQITKIYDTNKKITLICACTEGSVFVVTAFKKNSKTKYFEDCSPGSIVSFFALKSQRFNLERFDGKTFYKTPFNFEFIYMQHSKYKVFEKSSKKFLLFAT
uniref:Uncharacterized protein n=1 Tax=Meloidogyne enterolobii TaxID=390850 RepID=A0A6V7WE41_MELEN|nr:unnamed protein product [Meloidogyne enterolobii]